MNLEKILIHLLDDLGSGFRFFWMVGGFQLGGHSDRG